MTPLDVIGEGGLVPPQSPDARPPIDAIIDAVRDCER